MGVGDGLRVDPILGGNKMKRKGLISLTGILLVITVLMALLFIYVTYGTYKTYTWQQKKMEAFYITNAGINQAIWYLSNPTTVGGYGPKWRVKNLKKYFSVGSYTISVEEGQKPGEIIISSLGEVGRTKLMLEITAIHGKALPRVFDYALFSENELSMGGNSEVYGNIFINDNLRLLDNVSIRNGSAIISPGYNIETSGNPQFLKTLAKKPIPVFPMLDTTYYYEKIAHAKTKDRDIIQGDVEYKDLDLDGKTIYVNGNVNIKGDLKGSGTIVSTRNMTVSGTGRIDDGIYLIVNGKMSISGTHNVIGNPTLYSKQHLIIEDSTLIKGGPTLMSPTMIDIGARCNISGLIYGMSINLGKDSKISGSIIAENFSASSADRTSGVIKDINLRYDALILPITVQGFNVGSEMIMTKPGSLKEI